MQLRAAITQQVANGKKKEKEESASEKAAREALEEQERLAKEKGLQYFDDVIASLPNRSGINYIWVWIGMKLHKLCAWGPFDTFMNIIILLAVALVGVNTYPGMEDDIVVYVLEQCVLWLFISECVFKIWATRAGLGCTSPGRTVRGIGSTLSLSCSACRSFRSRVSLRVSASSV